MKFLLLICSCLIFAIGANGQITFLQRQRRVFYRNGWQNTTAPIYSSQTISKLVSQRTNQLTLTLNSILSRGSYQTNRNVLFAPVNIVNTLSTVMLGTAGKTQEELANALGMVFGLRLNDDIDLYHNAMGILLRKATSKNSDPNAGSYLDMAGGIFVQEDYEIKPKFELRAKKIYNSEVFPLDFSGDGQHSAQFINEWVSNKTHGKITQIVSPTLDANTKIVIAGALFFNGNWEDPFWEKTTKWQPFYLGSNGKYEKESVLVELMVNKGKIPHYQDTDYESIGIPYKGGDVIMYVVLPRLKQKMQQLLARFTHKDIDNIIENSTLSEVYYIMPKMKLDFQVNLRDTLQWLNVKTLFDSQKANFSNLAEGLHASDIIHKVNMDINEKGTTAAAATVGIINRGGYMNFRADRPFFFFIYNVKVGIMTFFGNIKKPIPWKPNNRPTDND